MAKASISERLKGLVVLHEEDERDRYVKEVAIRNGYVAVIAMMLGISAYREFIGGQPGIVWPAAVIAVFSLLVPLGQRLLSGGLAPADERVQRNQNRAFRWAWVVLFCGLAGLGMYRGIALNDPHAPWNFVVPFHAGALAILVTQVGHNTVRATTRGWLAAAVLCAACLGCAASLIVLVALSGQLGSSSSASFIVSTTLMVGIALGYIVLSLWAARRRRREEQVERNDEQLSAASKQ